MISGYKSSMNVKLDAPFEIQLKSPGTSGFEWAPDFNLTAFTLLESRQVPNLKKMGASGKVIFRFRPLSRGDYAIRFALMRPWEDEVAEHLEVSLHVD
jgi:predicted secreted protein